MNFLKNFVNTLRPHERAGVFVIAKAHAGFLLEPVRVEGGGEADGWGFVWALHERHRGWKKILLCAPKVNGAE